MPQASHPPCPCGADAHKPYAWVSYLGLYAVHWAAFLLVMGAARCVQQLNQEREVGSACHGCRFARPRQPLRPALPTAVPGLANRCAFTTGSKCSGQPTLQF